MEALCSGYTEVWISRSVAPLVLFADRVRALADTQIDMVGLPGRGLPAEWRTFDRIYSWYGTAWPEFRAAVEGLPFTFFPALPSGPPTGIPRIPLQGPRHDSVVLHPYSGGARKNWPLEHFRTLASHFGNVAWTCGPEEELPGAVRFADLAELGRWISGARLFIGNDSGITHLAAAVGTPTLAVFGPTDPAIWCPAGPHVRWTPFDSPDAVAAAAGELLRLL